MLHFDSLLHISLTQNDTLLAPRSQVVTFPIGGPGTNATVDGFGGPDFIHMTGDGHAVPPGYDEVTGVTADADLIYGGEGHDICYGNGGNDEITGGESYDDLYGEADNDTLFGENSSDMLEGGAGDDILYGGRGSDTFNPFDVSGTDTMYGGEGTDLFYVDDEIPIEARNEGIDAIIALGDYTLPQNIEDLSLVFGLGTFGTGNRLDNVIQGNADNNFLSGLNGDDDLRGYNGSDTLVGGKGVDILTGDLGAGPAAGADLFDFDAVTETGVGLGNRDIIVDFVHADGDFIDLSDIDANSNNHADQAFYLAGGLFTGHVRELIIFTEGGNTIVAGDTNGDAAADFEIQLTGVIALVADDFFL